MNAVITAGGRPTPGDALYPLTHGQPKALLPILGKPMIGYVVTALAATPGIARIAVVGLTPQEWCLVHRPWSAELTGVAVLPDHGGLLENAEAGYLWARQDNPQAVHVLLASCDVPTISPGSVQGFIEDCLRTEHDFYYGVVEKSVMEAAFPNSRRTYAPLREGRFCGCDVSLVRTDMTGGRRDVIQQLIQSRKSVWQLARAIGIGPLVRLLTHRLRLAEAEAVASRVLGVRGRAVICRYPELAMDVDKPFQVEIVQRYLQRRHLTPAAA